MRVTTKRRTDEKAYNTFKTRPKGVRAKRRIRNSVLHNHQLKSPIHAQNAYGEAGEANVQKNEEYHMGTYENFTTRQINANNTYVHKISI